MRMMKNYLAGLWPATVAALQLCAAPPPPNVVFILADDLGYGDLGCYGQTVIWTPNLDRLAREGLRFTQAYAGSTVCAPSRCALMTGRHTGHAYIRGNTSTPPEGQRPLPEGTETLGSIMKRAGYATGAFGKWALGGPDSSGEPARQGFDHFFGYLCQNQAHDYYPPYLRRQSEKVPLDGKTYSHTLIFNAALDFVRTNQARPFFLYLPVTLPHGKLEGPDDAPYTDRPWAKPLKQFAAMVTRLDHDVGRLMSLLQELGLDERTLVFFASDNGPEVAYFKPRQAGRDLVADYIATFHSAGPLRGFKRDLYEGGIRVPVTARWPGHIQPGVSEVPWAFWDVLPTLCDLTGQKAPPAIDGISVLPLLLGTPQQMKPHKYFYWEFHEGGFSQAVRFGDWKAVRLGTRQAVQLYNLKNDLNEQHDVAAEHPEIVRQSEQILRTAHTDSALFPIRENPKVPPKGSGYANAQK